MAKFSEKFFCPAPWSHIYSQINSPTPCHAIRYEHQMTPTEYLNSDWLKKIKADMVAGIVPEPCRKGCKVLEDQGLKSTRGAHWHWYNTGEEPEYERQWFADKFTADSPTNPYRIELRFSNLCNMKCRMCGEASSSEWAKEKLEHNIPFTKDFAYTERGEGESIVKIKDSSIEELKQLAKSSTNLRKVCLAGGEPFIIKEYYDYLDFLIQEGLNENLDIELYTNCSVYNPLFVERLKKFRKVEFVMSIDGVGKTAEYIRSGTKWDNVEKNVLQFNKTGKPFEIYFNTAISSYVLFDLENHAKFLMRLYNDNLYIKTKCYNVRFPEALSFNRLSKELRPIVIDQIDKAIEILNVPNFLIFVTELKNIRRNLLEKEPTNESAFYEFTKKYDTIRGESFEQVFNISLGNKD